MYGFAVAEACFRRQWGFWIQGLCEFFVLYGAYFVSSFVEVHSTATAGPGFGVGH